MAAPNPPQLPQSPSQPVQGLAGPANPLVGTLDPLDKLITAGSMRSVGVGDLLIVKQQIKRYEAGEIAHIANILKGEHNDHRVRRATTTEQTTLTETEQTKEEERDLQSTEHFDLKNEIEKTTKTDASLGVGSK